MDPTQVTQANFQDEVACAERPVVVEFWTDGCRPCRSLGHVVRRFEDRIKVVSCNVDSCPEIAAELGIMNLPTLLFFDKGEIVDRAIGTVNDVSEDEVAAICGRICN